MKKTILSALLITTMLFLSACNSSAASTTKGSEGPGKSTIETTNEANETSKQSENEKGTTPANSGKYTYTVYAGTQYETTLTMDVNIDDYLVDKGEGVLFFRIDQMAKDLGWYLNGDPNFDGLSSVYYRSYVYGDTQMVYTCGDIYSGSNNPTGYPQIGSFTYHLAPISNYDADARTKEEIQSSEKNYGISVTFSQHSDSLCYSMVNSGTRVGVSRDDIVVLTYVLSSAVSHPGENPFYGTNLAKAKSSVADRYILYTLP
ncbi:MAG: hypothetical protein E7386_03015 [Ruminococcaceae bacterium]|nr:hypothetical protein [Oscillospiraceae bacterium]